MDPIFIVLFWLIFKNENKAGPNLKSCLEKTILIYVNEIKLSWGEKADSISSANCLTVFDVNRHILTSTREIKI